MVRGELLGETISYGGKSNLANTDVELVMKLWKLTRCMLGKFSWFCCRLLTFLSLFSPKLLSGPLLKCQTV